MKLLITLELTLLLFASTFRSHNPPGWYQVQLPVNNLINDIQFLDSLNGYVITERSGGSAYILHTTDGGSNWQIQFSENYLLTSIDFADAMTGYAVGSVPPGIVLKTTNSGNNWFTVATSTFYPIKDVDFVNAHTGWVCSDDLFGGGGVFRTTDGGSTWQRLTEPGEFSKLFFLNKDTGWVNANGTQKRLYRTTNGGLNWQLQFTSAFAIDAIFFLDGQRGWIRGGPDLNGNGVSYTTNGGFNFTSSVGNPNIYGGWDVEFVTESLGYAGFAGNKILKSTNGGISFGDQYSPAYGNIVGAFLRNDTLNGWFGRGSLAKTSDGGGVITDVIPVLEIAPIEYRLFQNYPNPFNASTKIAYDLVSAANVTLMVYDVLGKELGILVNEVKNSGRHEVDFNASNLPSGVYLYSLHVDGKQIGVRRMTLVK